MTAGVVAVLVAALLPISSRAAAAPVSVDTACDPNRIMAVVNGKYSNAPDFIFQTEGSSWQALCRYQHGVLERFTQAEGREYNAVERARLLSFGRNQARAIIFADLVRLALIPDAERTADERVALNWFADRIRDVKIRIAQEAKAEYNRWDVDPCAYVAPEHIGQYAPGASCGTGPQNLVSLFTGPPLPPEYSQFANHGARTVLATLNTPDVAAAVGEMSRVVEHVTAGSLVIAGAIAAGAAWAGISVAAGAASSLFPFAAFSAIALVALLPVAIVLIAVIIAIVRFIQIDEGAQVPIQLDADIAAAQAWGLGNLPAFLNDANLEQRAGNAGMALAAFVDGTLGPYNDASLRAAAAVPDAPVGDVGFLRDNGSTVVPSYVDKFTYYTVDGTIEEAWLDDTWWVLGPTGGPKRVSTLLVHYDPVTGAARSARLEPDTGAFVVIDADSKPMAGGACTAPKCHRTYTLQIQAGPPANPAPISIRRTVPVDVHMSGLAASYDYGATATLNAWSPQESVVRPVTYRWRISPPGGGLGVAPALYTGSSIEHRFDRPGEHTVAVTATASDGSTLTRTWATTVGQPPEPGPNFLKTLLYQVGDACPPGGVDDIGWEEHSDGTDYLYLFAGEFDAPIYEFGELHVNWDGEDTLSGNVTSRFAVGDDVPGPCSIPRPGWLVDEGTYPIMYRAKGVGENAALDSGWQPLTLFVTNVAPDEPELELRAGDDEWAGGDTPFTYPEGTTVEARFKVSDRADDLTHATVQWGGAAVETIDLATTDPGDDGWYHVSRVFPDDFAGSVTVSAHDDAGATASTSASLTITNTPPEVHITGTHVDASGAATLTATYVDQPGDAILAEIDWGDGTEPDVVTLPQAGAPADSITGAHTYLTRGTRTVAVKVYDDAAMPASDTTTIALTNLAPRITGVDSPSIATGTTTAALQITAHDADGDPLDVDVTWGDGNTTAAALDTATGTFLATHTYATHGTYAVHVEAFDGTDPAAPVHGTISVVDPATTTTTTTSTTTTTPPASGATTTTTTPPASGATTSTTPPGTVPGGTGTAGDFGTARPGTRRRIPIVNRKPHPLTITSVLIRARGSADRRFVEAVDASAAFTIVADGCTGQVLAPGAACEVEIELSASAGTYAAELVLVTDDGEISVALRAVADPAAPPAAPSGTVPGTAPASTATPGGQLPVTGAGSGSTMAVALLALAAGVVLLLASRRARPARG